MTPRSAPMGGSTVLGYIIPLFGLICTYVVAADLWANIQVGGDPWKQADWLINEINQPVRRGAFGSALIWIADSLGVSPLVPVYVVQLACLLILSACLLLVLQRAEPKAALALIVFSPAFLFVFWAADPGGSLRKEALGYAAIALLLLAPLYPGARRAVAAASVLIFGLACIGHEINVLLAPTYALVFLLCLRPGWALGVGLLVYLAVMGGGTMAYAIAHTSVVDHASICTPLTQRGVDPDFCIGAILWMERGTDYGAEQVAMMFLSLRSFGFYLISYGLIAAPFLYLISRVDRPFVVLAAALLLILPILPLYPVAVDWGRWMNLHVMSFVFVFLAALITDVIKVVRPVHPVVLVLVILLGLIWEQPHAEGPRLGGLLAELMSNQGVGLAY